MESTCVDGFVSSWLRIDCVLDGEESGVFEVGIETLILVAQNIYTQAP